MSKVTVILFSAVVLIVALFAVLILGESKPPSLATSSNGTPAPPLVVYCAASNQTAMEAIRQDYEAEFGVNVEIQYGSSQSLLNTIQIRREGDLFLPADDSYFEKTKAEHLTEEVLPLAKMRAGVAVLKGNPKQIHALDDLLRENITVIQANPDGAAIGKVTRQLLTESGRWEDLEKATTGFLTTVIDVANDIKLGAADAGIVYDAVLHTYPELEFVEIPELEAGTSHICIGVLTSTASPSRALHFARYAAARDRGLKRYAEFGFVPEAGDQWADRPELQLFAGAMLRTAIEDTIIEFEQREGVEVTRVYNGCGILVANMKTGQHPDAYFACDREFMDMVPDLFPVSVDVSQNQLVILVQKGNPHKITSLKDLSKEGIRVGIGHEKQCAMGWLTQNTFREGGVQQEVMENVTVQAATGDLLVNQMRAGSLDAAVVYLSNAAGSGDFLEAYQIDGIQCAIAVQPFGISPESPYPQLLRRLLDRIQSEKSQQAFLDQGFQWKADLK
ncbi:MAG: substrate-binding domain-containing protein [Planctomycetaceae bacterium]|nr:substrate-binding domain-containing protein [Planctomycetaceae bacterium]